MWVTLSIFILTLYKENLKFMQMQQKSKHWSEKNFSPFALWIWDIIIDFIKCFYWERYHWNSENVWTEFFSDQWFDLCCIWIYDSLLAVQSKLLRDFEVAICKFCIKLRFTAMTVSGLLTAYKVSCRVPPFAIARVAWRQKVDYKRCRKCY